MKDIFNTYLFNDLGTSGNGCHSNRFAAKETKSRRMQFLVKPSTAAKLKAAADAGGLSVNDLINRILEEYLERRR